MLATGGDTFLGGDDFDQVIANSVAETIMAKTGRDPRTDAAARQRLLHEAERAKCDLSAQAEVTLDLSVLAGVPMQARITRSEFNDAIKGFIDRCLALCAQALKDAGLHVSEIDGVVMVGGSTRIPAVREAVTKFFRREPDQGIDPDLVVGVGAALYAQQLDQPVGQKRLLLDVTPMTLRLATVGGYTEAIIQRNAPIPTERTRLFTTSRDRQEMVSLRVYQGEEEQEEDNTLLGEFVFGPLPPRPRGEVEIAVTFAIDTDGLVQVTALDQATGQAAVGRINLAVSSEAPVSRERSPHGSIMSSEWARWREQVLDTAARLDEIDYFRLLGCPPDPSPATLRTCFRRLATSYHPTDTGRSIQCSTRRSRRSIGASPRPMRSCATHTTAKHTAPA